MTHHESGVRPNTTPATEIGGHFFQVFLAPDVHIRTLESAERKRVTQMTETTSLPSAEIRRATISTTLSCAESLTLTALGDAKAANLDEATFKAILDAFSALFEAVDRVNASAGLTASAEAVTR